MEVIRNKVAESGIITLDLANYLANQADIAMFDLKPFLFMEMILKEKDYRAALATHDWQQYKDKDVAVFCSVDAIVPLWSYMLAATYLQPIARSVYFGSAAELSKHIMLHNIGAINALEYEDKRVVVKGCGDKQIPEAAYVAITEKLRPVVKSLMYGEPCSTVPIFKKPATKQED
ncbi:MAG: hypothetical protein BGO70_00920 [Bacteroidetes bacterium 43-93]|nr:DUF2480 family protein [Bacteroidota bacterium]OJW96274.1 MAG: hypothetical protein BGO70_00920 [Bacteroidetes bacterium 43-93]